MQRATPEWGMTDEAKKKTSVSLESSSETHPFVPYLIEIELTLREHGCCLNMWAHTVNV